jgi:exodeoxyribonuclease-3
MRVATWNVNSVKAHLEVVTRWLAETKPDVVCLQEIKCEDHNFPTSVFEDMGYNAAVLGQKSYNGVAILSKFAMEAVVRGLPGDDGDEQARFIQCSVSDGAASTTIASLYLPNGNPAGSPKLDYKLAWMERLIAHARTLLRNEERFVLAGDYNVIPTAGDARTPAQWIGDALFVPQTRGLLFELANLGLSDAFRSLHPRRTRQYTFYDYQAGAWQKENGIRIDHLMLSPQAADQLQAVEIDKHVRGWDRPSDHVPIWIDLAA